MLGLFVVAVVALAPQSVSLAKAKPKFTLNDVYGGYTSSNGIEILKGGTYIESSVNCFGRQDGVDDRLRGTWLLDGDVLELTPRWADVRGGGGRVQRLVPVKWGTRMYLIEEHRMPGFAASANPSWEGSLDNMGRYTDEFKVGTVPEYTKVGPDMQVGRVFGKPLLPDRYLPPYEKGAVTVRVDKLLSDDRVSLVCKAGYRLRKGQELAYDYVGSGENSFEGWMNLDVLILQVNGNTAMGRVLPGFECKRKVKVGDVFTSGERWNTPMGPGTG